MKFTAATILAAAGAASASLRGPSPESASSEAWPTPTGLGSWEEPSSTVKKYGEQTDPTGKGGEQPWSSLTSASDEPSATGWGHDEQPTGTGIGWEFSSGEQPWSTVTVDKFTTVCPYETTFEHGGKTYSASASETLTIWGPATVVYPTTTSAVVECTSCSAPTSASVYQSAPVPIGTGVPAPAPVYTTPVYQSPTPSAASAVSPESPVATAGAARRAALSGAGLAGLLGLAVFVL